MNWRKIDEPESVLVSVSVHNVFDFEYDVFYTSVSQFQWDRIICFSFAFPLLAKCPESKLLFYMQSTELISLSVVSH